MALCRINVAMRVAQGTCEEIGSGHALGLSRATAYLESVPPPVAQWVSVCLACTTPGFSTGQFPWWWVLPTPERNAILSARAWVEPAAMPTLLACCLTNKSCGLLLPTSEVQTVLFPPPSWATNAFACSNSDCYCILCVCKVLRCSWKQQKPFPECRWGISESLIFAGSCFLWQKRWWRCAGALTAVLFPLFWHKQWTCGGSMHGNKRWHY